MALASVDGRHQAMPAPRRATVTGWISPSWPRPVFPELPVGHADLCADPGGLTLIDTSLPGSAPRSKPPSAPPAGNQKARRAQMRPSG
jgi:hypothetical protein